MGCSDIHGTPKPLPTPVFTPKPAPASGHCGPLAGAVGGAMDTGQFGETLTAMRQAAAGGMAASASTQPAKGAVGGAGGLPDTAPPKIHYSGSTPAVSAVEDADLLTGDGQQHVVEYDGEADVYGYGVSAPSAVAGAAGGPIAATPTKGVTGATSVPGQRFAASVTAQLSTVGGVGTNVLVQNLAAITNPQERDALRASAATALQAGLQELSLTIGTWPPAGPSRNDIALLNMRLNDAHDLQRVLGLPRAGLAPAEAAKVHSFMASKVDQLQGAVNAAVADAQRTGTTSPTAAAAIGERIAALEHLIGVADDPALTRRLTDLHRSIVRI